MYTGLMYSHTLHLHVAHASAHKTSGSANPVGNHQGQRTLATFVLGRGANVIRPILVDWVPELERAMRE